jgi:hypothetical protein
MERHEIEELQTEVGDHLKKNGYRPFIEFREDETADDDRGRIEIYFLGVHVQTIRDVNNRPGGWNYTDKEQTTRRAEKAVKHLWNLVGEATPETRTEW